MILEIDGAHANIKFSSTHFIPNHEKCSRLHGHSYIIRARLEGEMDDKGMVMDFVILKKRLREIADGLDHMILLPGRSTIVKVEGKGGSYEVTSCDKRYVFPAEDVVVLDVFTTTAEAMSKMIAEMLAADLEWPSNISSVSIGIDEERGQTAWYRVNLQ